MRVDSLCKVGRQTSTPGSGNGGKGDVGRGGSSARGNRRLWLRFTAAVRYSDLAVRGELRTGRFLALQIWGVILCDLFNTINEQVA